MQPPRSQERQGGRQEPDAGLDLWANRTIGAAIEVHRVLGPGYLEVVYERALAVEFTLRGIPFSRQAHLDVQYKEHPVGVGWNDFLVAGQLVVELKAVEALTPVFTAQLISYLKARNLMLGLLINFNEPLLKNGIRRLISSC
jgi:GxxExxY protein